MIDHVFNPGQPDERIDRLIDAYLDDTVSQEDADQLGRWLLADAANARHYARRSVMHQRLREKLHGEPMAQLSIELSEQGSGSEHGFWSLVEALDDHNDTQNLRDLTEEYARREQAKRDQQRLAKKRARGEEGDGPRSIVIVIPRLVAIAALVGLVGMIGLFVYSFMPDRPDTPQQQQAQVTPLQPALPIEVAQVAWSLDAVWADRLDRPDEARMLQGVYTLEQGVVEIAYDRGASSIIQGPATFELIDDNTARLTTGRLTARVPEEAKGFTVITPKARVVDFGTEFGVEVEENGSTTAAVFTGIVELSAELIAGETNTSSDETRSITLSKGWQSRVDENAVLDDSSVRLDPTRHFLLDRDDALYRPVLSGDGRYIREDPTSLAMGQFSHPKRVSVLLEQTAIKFPKTIRRVVTNPGQYAARPANLQEGRIAAGRVCDSYLVHFEPGVADPDSVEAIPSTTVTLTFPRPIIGVITVGDALFETDPFCARPKIGLPKRSDFEDGKGLGRGVDAVEDSKDTVELSDDRRTLTLSLHSSLIDQVRVLIEPSEKMTIEP